MFHTQTHDAVAKNLGSSIEKGLTSQQATEAIERYGSNELKKTKSFTALKAFLAQFQSSLVVILIIAAVISYFVAKMDGEPIVDSVVIILIVIINAILGFLQEFKAEKSLENLRNMLVPVTKVVRDGKIQEIPSKDLVPGDILIINEGDTISADARVIESRRLQVDEAALTGESLPREKSSDVLSEETPLAERENMIYQGTDVVAGSGRAIVVETGMNTELGKISTLVQDIVEDKNPFQQKLDAFARKVGFVIIILCLIVVGGLVWGGDEWTHAFVVAVSLAVSAIPEGLPAVISLGFALATTRLVKKQVVVRKLPSSETLGRVTVICTDKTGTLTKSRMEVVDIHTADDQAKKHMFLAAALNHNVDVMHENGTEKLLGDPTEVALVRRAIISGAHPEKKLRQYPKMDEIPFTSERKMMTTIHEYQSKKVAYTKGAPERILSIASYELVGGKEKKITPKRRDEIHKEYEEMAKEGLRVLGYAYKNGAFTSRTKDETIESDMVFLGFLGMQDPARDEVPDSIAACHKAGIRVVMVTGDGLLTAKAIAHKIGMKGDAIDSTELSKLSDAQLLKKLETTSVLSRVEPSDKLRVVDLLKSQGEIVAMTGDGVNDALALKRADIGVAMGIRGTDVSKSAADMVLLDDNFASIVEGVREGRRMFTNIKKFVTYLLAANFYEVVLVFSVIVVFRDPHLLPFLPLQILWINLATDSLPALALSTQEAEKDIMERKPVHGELLDGVKGFLIAGGLTGFGLLAVTLWLYHSDMYLARTMIVTVSVFYQMLLAINCASKAPAWKAPGNTTLWWAIIVSLGLHVALMYSFVGRYFSFQKLEWEHWAVVAVLGFLGFTIIEAYKILRKYRIVRV